MDGRFFINKLCDTLARILRAFNIHPHHLNFISYALHLANGQMEVDKRLGVRKDFLKNIIVLRMYLRIQQLIAFGHLPAGRDCAAHLLNQRLRFFANHIIDEALDELDAVAMLINAKSAAKQQCAFSTLLGHRTYIPFNRAATEFVHKVISSQLAIEKGSLMPAFSNKASL